MRRQIINVSVWVGLITLFGFMAWLKSLLPWHQDGNGRPQPTNFAATVLLVDQKPKRIAPKTKNAQPCPPNCNSVLIAWDGSRKDVRHTDAAPILEKVSYWPPQ